MRLASRTDANHSEIVLAARKLGFRVLSLAPLGQGCPDLLLFCPRTRRFHLVEVKTPTGKLRALQERFMQEWPVTVIRQPDELIALLTAPSP